MDQLVGFLIVFILIISMPACIAFTSLTGRKSKKNDRNELVDKYPYEHSAGGEHINIKSHEVAKNELIYQSIDIEHNTMKHYEEDIEHSFAVSIGYR